MNLIKNNIFKALFLSHLFLGLTLGLTGCGGEPLQVDEASTSPADLPPEDQDDVLNSVPPNGYSTANLFVSSANSVTYPNLTTLANSSHVGSYGSRCEFTSSSLVNDLTCITEVAELSSFFNGVDLYFNLPAGQCKYLGVTPYWYYNYEIGTGPAAVTIETTRNASGVVTGNRCGTSFGGGLSSGNCTTSPDPDVTFQADDSGQMNVVCNYDTSNLETGKNCCLGKYDMTRISVTPDATTPSISRGVNWGPTDARECIGGAGRTNWETFNRQGLPVRKIQRITDQTKPFTEILKIDGPLFTLGGSSSNIPVANFFTPGAHTHSGYGGLTGVTSEFPYYVDPISDRSGSPIVSGNPYYTFDCLDEAAETNFRIKMLVREWNINSIFSTYLGSGNLGLGPDAGGTALANCPGQNGSDCNNIEDADDFVDQLGGTYDTSSGPLRSNYFPKHQY